jgi:1,4-dihydroxy-2-naphthoate octaprenyltransferase
VTSGVGSALGRPSGARAWWMAARPATLAAAVSPVLVGTAMALFHGAAAFAPALAALVGALLIQVATNFANDYFDARRGVDSAERLGPTRVVQAGILSPEAVLKATFLVLATALLMGAYLVWVGGVPILVIGLASIACALAYTGGPFPLAELGLGDLFVFVFFGLIAVGGTYFVQTATLTADVLLAGAGVGALTTAILVVNNLRDVETDARAGRRTLAVRLGPNGAKGEFLALVAGAAIVPALGVLVAGWPVWALLALLGLTPALRTTETVLRYVDPRELNPALRAVAKGVTWYGGLLALGFVIGAAL